MRNVIDTSALFSKAAIRALADSELPTIVPAVVFTERARQILRDGGDVQRYRNLLLDLDFRVEPFGETEALRYAVHIHAADAWRRLARDAMIAGHVGKEDQLWTANAKDFHEVGVRPDQIVEVPLGAP